MTDQKHTLGRLTTTTVDGGWDGVAEEQYPSSIICKLVLNNPANAKRLADCWNACEGINPEAVPDLLEAAKLAADILGDLAAGEEPFNWYKVEHVKAERGKLLAAIAKAKGE